MKLFLTKCRAETLFKNIEIEKRREKYFHLIFNIEIALAIISDIIRLQELQKEQKKCVHALCQLPTRVAKRAKEMCTRIMPTAKVCVIIYSKPGNSDISVLFF